MYQLFFLTECDGHIFILLGSPGKNQIDSRNIIEVFVLILYFLHPTGAKNVIRKSVGNLFFFSRKFDLNQLNILLILFDLKQIPIH